MIHDSALVNCNSLDEYQKRLYRLCEGWSNIGTGKETFTDWFIKYKSEAKKTSLRGEIGLLI